MNNQLGKLKENLPILTPKMANRSNNNNVNNTYIIIKGLFYQIN